MGQPAALLARYFLPLLLALAIGCQRSPTTASSPATTRPLTVASLSPAATEILIGMGAGDRLVAVSNFDPPREQTKKLPRVGDYQTTDWERLSEVRPNVMITQFAPNRLPAGLVNKARDLGIALVNVPITRLDDIYAAMITLGKALHDEQLGQNAAAALERKLGEVAARSQGRKVRALIVVDESGRGAVGRDNYLNDVLEIAGGVNVIRPGTAPYPTIDPETLLDLDPEVIFQLLPEAAPQVLAKARQTWQTMPNLRAVRNGRVHVFAEPYFVQPSQRVGELAEKFASCLNEARSASVAGSQP